MLATAGVGSGETKKAGPAKDLQKPNNQSQTVVKAHELSSVPDVHDYENKPAEKGKSDYHLSIRVYGKITMNFCSLQLQKHEPP